MGSGSEAQFNEPDGVAVDTNGNVYVADTVNNTVGKSHPRCGDDHRRKGGIWGHLGWNQWGGSPVGHLWYYD